MKGKVDVSIVTVAYNNGAVLIDSVRAAIATSGPDVEIIVVNNGKRAPEIDEVERMGARVVTPEQGNVGFSAGCNAGVAASRGALICFLNPDAIPTEGWLPPLVRRARKPDVGAVQALLCFADRPDHVNAAGCAIHISGYGWMDRFGKPASTEREGRDIAFACAGAMMMRRELFDSFGGFCEEYFLYHEDLELGWRLHLAGYRSVLEPASVVLHDYEFGRHGATKNYFIERNRWIFLATCYPTSLLVATAPVLAAFELGVVGMALKDGWFGDLLRGRRWCLEHRRWLRSRRRTVLGSTKVDVGRMADVLTPKLDPANFPLPPGAWLLNRVLRSYWGVARRVVDVASH